MATKPIVEGIQSVRWAYAMEEGIKRVETRSWPMHWYGDLVICSSKRKLDALGYEVAIQNGVPVIGLLYGFALCVVEIYDCVPTGDALPALKAAGAVAEMDLGDYTPGRFAWLTRNCRRLALPVPVVGRQGLFDLPADVEAKVRAQLENR